MLADRDLERRLNNLSESSSMSINSGSESDRLQGLASGRLLKIDIAGMDQAKFKCLRNLASAKSIAELWRPSLDVIGIICWGGFEEYVFMGG